MKVISKDATYECNHPYHINMKILAVPCDRNLECKDGLDEQSCDTNFALWLIALSVIFTMVIIVMYYLLQRWLVTFQERSESPEAQNSTEESIQEGGQQEKMDVKCSTQDEFGNVWNSLIKLLDVPESGSGSCKEEEEDRREFAMLHNSSAYQEYFKMWILTVQLCYSKARARRVHRNLYNLEMELHSSNEPAVKLCLLRSLGTCKTVMNILDDQPNDSLIRKVKEKVSPISDLIERFMQSRVPRFFQFTIFTTLAYLDLYKDIFILMIMLNVAGSIYRPAIFVRFTSQVCIIQLLSIIMPFMFSGLHNALYHPAASIGIFEKQYSSWKSGLLSVFIMIISPLILAILMFKKFLFENILFTLKMSFSGKWHSKVLPATIRNGLKRLMLAEHIISNIKINEQSLEQFPQITMQILIVLMGLTQTPTHSGFQTLFSEESLMTIPAWVLLSVSILIGLFSACMKGLSHNKIRKCGFLPLVGTLTIFLR